MIRAASNSNGLLDKLTDDLKRINERNEVRTAAWREAGYTLQAVEGWLRDGRPPGTTLQEYEGEPPKLNKGETVIDAIERLRRRVRELKADAHRIASSPFPSTYSKKRMREAVEALALQGAPSVSRLIEHDREIEWPMQMLRSEVHNTQVPSVAFAETHNLLPMIAWLHKDALIKRLDAEIDAEADDKNSLSHEDRQRRLSEVQQDLLAIERDESEFVWSAMSQNLPVQHRKDINPVALLSVALRTVSHVNPSGTTGDHAFDVVFGARRR